MSIYLNAKYLFILYFILFFIGIFLEEFLLISIFVGYVSYLLKKHCNRFLFTLLVYSLRYSVYCSEDLSVADKLLVTGFAIGFCFCLFQGYKFMQMERVTELYMRKPLTMEENIDLGKMAKLYNEQKNFDPAFFNTTPEVHNAFLNYKHLYDTVFKIDNLIIRGNLQSSWFAYNRLDEQPVVSLYTISSLVADVYLYPKTYNPFVNLLYLAINLMINPGLCSVTIDECVILLEKICWRDLLTLNTVLEDKEIDTIREIVNKELVDLEMREQLIKSLIESDI